MIRRKSRLYVATLISGIPFSVDKALELVADPDQHLNFVHGMSVFVLYFHSRKKLREINETFITMLRDEVEIIFVTKVDRLVSNHMAPQVRMEMERVHDENNDKIIYNDIDSLRMIINEHMRFSQQNKSHNIPAPQKHGPSPETPVSDQEIMRQLLDKMKVVGYNKLSPAELDFLKSYSDKLKRQKDQDDVD